jgi:pyridoxine 5'-phosphate synthase PdxJ
MDSEHEIDRGHADLTMIIRPDKRHGKVFDVLIEFKFVTLKEAGLDGEKARKLSETELRELPQMQTALKTGRDQALSYGDRLEKKYQNLRLKRFVVASLGFERICFEAVGN